MKKYGGLIWGLVLVVIGIVLVGNATGLFNVNIFFDGWWTLFIIVPCFIGLITDNEKTGSFIGLVIGVLLLLACQDVVDFDLILKLIFPIIILVIGLSLIIKNVSNTEFNDEIKKINQTNEVKEEYAATFAGQDIKIDKEEFKGTTINAVFGGVKLDLTDAVIKEDVVINASSIFGGIDIILPEGVVVKIKSNSMFGGVDNKYKNKEKKATSKKEITVYVNASCLFGGVDIK